MDVPRDHAGMRGGVLTENPRVRRCAERRANMAICKLRRIGKLGFIKFIRQARNLVNFTCIFNAPGVLASVEKHAPVKRN